MRTLEHRDAGHFAYGPEVYSFLSLGWASATPGSPNDKKHVHHFSSKRNNSSESIGRMIRLFVDPKYTPASWLKS